MTKKTLTMFGLLALASCNQQQPAAAPPPPPPPPPAAPVAVGTTPAPAAVAEAPKPPPATGAERAKWFGDCWAAFNAKDWAKFAPCYAENASSEQVDSGVPPLVGRNEVVEKNAKLHATEAPDQAGDLQLVLVNGNNIAAVSLIKGTNTGPLMTPGGELPATKKKFGLLMGHAAETTEDGHAIAHDRLYLDGATFMGQLGLAKMPHRKVVEKGAAEKPVVIATGSDVEKANLAGAAKTLEGFNKHDLPTLLASLTDDVVFSEASSPADQVGKKAVEKSFKNMFKAFSDLKLEVSRGWAAGDYVVFEGALVGTNDGAMPSMGIPKPTGKKVNCRYLEIDKLVNGKVKNMWVFDNGMAFAMQLGLMSPPAPKPAPAAKPGAAPAAAAPAAAGAPAPAAKAAGPAPAAAPAMKPAPAAPAAKPAPAAPAAATAPAAKPATPAAPAAPAATAAKPPAAPAAAPKAPAAPAAPAPAAPAPAPKK